MAHAPNHGLDGMPDREPDQPLAELPDRVIASGRLEVCAAFVTDPDAPGGICASCGWLLDDHRGREARRAA